MANQCVTSAPSGAISARLATHCSSLTYWRNSFPAPMHLTWQVLS